MTNWCAQWESTPLHTCSNSDIAAITAKLTEQKLPRKLIIVKPEKSWWIQSGFWCKVCVGPVRFMAHACNIQRADFTKYFITFGVYILWVWCCHIITNRKPRTDSVLLAFVLQIICSPLCSVYANVLAHDLRFLFRLVSFISVSLCFYWNSINFICFSMPVLSLSLSRAFF